MNLQKIKIWRCGWGLLVVLVCLLLPVRAGAQRDRPVRVDPYVNDFAAVLTADDAQAVRNTFVTLKRDRGIEAVLVTVASTGDQTTADFAADLFDAWEMADVASKDRVLLLMAADVNEVHIELGSHYGGVMARAMDVVIADKIMPEIEAGDVSHALRLGATNLVTALTVRTTGSQSLERYATGLFNKWGIGDAQKNNGVLLLIAVDDRAARIELGSGYGSYKDRVMQQIMDDVMLPRFRNGNYSAGQREGARAIVADLTRSPISSFFASLSLPTLAGAGMGFLAVVVGSVQVYRRRRPRRCPQCATAMFRLDRLEAGKHLSLGECAEVDAGSVAHDVWECPGCEHHLIAHYRNWLNRHQKCPSCSFRTVKQSRHVVTAATYASSGVEDIIRDCRHCSFHDVRQRTIRQKTRSESSSSSGGGGSFGGGHSSGGGASGRW